MSQQGKTVDERWTTKRGRTEWSALPAIESYGPAPADDLLAYPGRTPETSFWFDGTRLLAVSRETTLREIDSWLRAAGATPIEQRVAILAAGSNANPPQMLRKVRGVDGDRSVLMLRARVPALVSAFAAHVAGYGAIPATFFPRRPGGAGSEQVPRRERLFLGLYPRGHLQRLHRSEGPKYALRLLRALDVTTARGEPVRPVYGYVSRAGALSWTGADAIPLHATSQRRLLARLLDAAGLDGGRLLSLDDYLTAPGRHREPLCRRILDRGLAIENPLSELPEARPDRCRTIGS